MAIKAMATGDADSHCGGRFGKLGIFFYFTNSAIFTTKSALFT